MTVSERDLRVWSCCLSMVFSLCVFVSAGKKKKRETLGIVFSAREKAKRKKQEKKKEKKSKTQRKRRERGRREGGAWSDVVEKDERDRER